VAVVAGKVVKVELLLLGFKGKMADFKEKGEKLVGLGFLGTGLGGICWENVRKGFGRAECLVWGVLLRPLSAIWV
jgi:hypothetical protein